MRKKIFSILLSLIVVVAVYLWVGAERIGAALSQLNPIHTLVLLLLYALGQVLSAYKWRKICLSLELPRSFDVILRAYFLGMFVNVAGLGTIGGDGARALSLRPEEGKKIRALATVAVDRLHGLLTLAVIGFIGVLIEPPPFLGSYARPLAAGAVLLGLLFLGAAPTLANSIADSISLPPRVERGIKAIARLSWRTLAEITLLSAAFHVLQISMHYLIAYDLDLSVSFWQMLAIVPFVNILSSLPISFNGLGVRELTFITLLSPLGVSEDGAVAIGAIWFGVSVGVSLLGGLALRTMNLEHSSEKTSVAGSL